MQETALLGSESLLNCDISLLIKGQSLLIEVTPFNLLGCWEHPVRKRISQEIGWDKIGKLTTERREVRE